MSRVLRLMCRAAVLALAGCGGPGLPPAGPKPGEVEVGYDTKKATETTGAVSSVSGDKVGQNRPMELHELLRGRVAGLQITETPAGVTYRIRGVNSMQSDKEPLFVVDGVRMTVAGATASLAGITLADIRQVDVLKDVASTAVYGTAGAGGVIIITTKR